MEIQPPLTPATDNGKTIAIVSYFTWIGWIIALVMHGSNKTSLGAYHLRQTLALHLLTVVLYAIQLMLLFSGVWMLSTAISLLFIGVFVLWILGLIPAINGEEKPIPLLGMQAQMWFANAFK